MGFEEPGNSPSWKLERLLDSAEKENKRLRNFLIQALTFLERPDIGETHHYLNTYTSHELAQWWKDNKPTTKVKVKTG